MTNPRTVEEVLMDFRGRRAGIIKALTKDMDLFFQLCDPDEHRTLCLFGLPSQRWEVNLLPPLSELPEPKSGINLIRDSMPKKEWLSVVALHSDAWLHSVASYFSAKYKFDKADRKRLFNKISDVSLISEVIISGTARKRGKAESGGLPNEMLVEILTRLPVKDLLRYRMVCNNWRSLIDDPEFVSGHLRSYKSNIAGSHLLVMERRKNCQKSEKVLVRRSDNFRKVTEVENFDYTTNTSNRFNVGYITYINGLVLVWDGRFKDIRRIILWNPSINKSVNVFDPMPQEIRDATYFELGLGFDASINDYKVVAFTYPCVSYKFISDVQCYQTHNYATICHAAIPGSVHVYTLLSTNSWITKHGVHPPTSWAVGSQVFVDGAMHWMSFGPNVTDDAVLTLKDYKYIVSFDVGNEVFNYFETPSVATEPVRDKFLIVMDGCLAMFCAHISHNDIWIMNEYGISNSWSKCYTFSLQFSKILHFKGNGELLFAVDGIGIKSYDVKRKWIKDLAKTYCKSSEYTVYTYVESLVLSSM